MCDKAIEEDPGTLEFVPGHLKTQEFCDKAVEDDSYSLQYIPDWFVTQQQIDVWYDDDYVYNDDEVIECYKGYKKREAQKASIKKELIPIAWHPSRWWDWCMSEDEKKEIEKLWE